MWICTCKCKHIGICKILCVCIWIWKCVCNYIHKCAYVYAYVYIDRTRAQKGFLFVQHANIENFNSVSLRLPKYPPTAGEVLSKSRRNNHAVVTTWIQNKNSGHAPLKTGEVFNTFLSRQFFSVKIANNQRSFSKNPSLTDSRQKRAQKKKHRPGTTVDTFPFWGKEAADRTGCQNKNDMDAPIAHVREFCFWSSG